MNEQDFDTTLDLSMAQSVLAGPNRYGYPDETFVLAEQIVAGNASKDERNAFWTLVWNAQDNYFEALETDEEN